MPRRHRAACAFLLGVILIRPLSAAVAASSWEPDPYSLGEGLYFPQEGLRVGGYADVFYFGLNHGTSSVSVEDLSLFLTKDIGSRWKIFSETEIGEALTITDHAIGTADASLEIERLYADYFASSAATFRFGRFLTPVGQWNLVHADPLVWTISRPLSTAAGFSRSTNGAMLYGTRTVEHNDLDYTLFVDDTRAIGIANDTDYAYGSYGAAGETSPLKNEFTHAAGGQLHYHAFADALSIGTSLATFELNSPRQSHRLVGLDFDWLGSDLELSSESVYRTADGPQAPAEYGGFLQAVASLPHQVFLVGRYEHYRNSLPDETDNLWTLGVNYRPSPGIVVKVERDDSIRKSTVMPSGWFASFAVLF